MELNKVRGGNNGRRDHNFHGKAILAAKVMKSKVENLPEETRTQLKADAEALKAQRKDHLEITRGGVEALRSQATLAREDGTVTDEEKAQLKADAGALRTQAQDFRKEDRAGFKSLIQDIRTALKGSAQPPAPVAPAPAM